MELHVQKFLREFGISKLKEQYGIKVREYSNKLIVLNYDQLNSPTLHPITKECRCLILDAANNYEVVSRSFDRFFNLNEKPDSTIKTFSNDMELFEKLDGSIINIYFYQNKWNISTKSAAFAEFSFKENSLPFKDIILQTLKLDEKSFQEVANKILKPDYTYIFEFTGENKVIKNYKENSLSFLAMRHIKTGEYNKNIDRIDLTSLNIKRPKKYKLNSMDDIKTNLKQLSGFDEGFVLYKNGMPIAKIKTLAYLTMALINGEQGFSTKNLTKIVISGEESEFLTYFPQYKNQIDEIKSKYNDFIHKFKNLWNISKDIIDKKEFALSLINEDQTMKSILFLAKKEQPKDINEFFYEKINIDTKLKYLL